ncbi:hypothetical protein PR202_ga15202 [Eleusine coracana subsp. coracana]|uniref:Uncharacterized protein n=1 Tax=Eleusine coracana subsp. coracana TaxID=191504 RepID=A0AAV5CJK1_ELECO|nr:hypothetical protein PR202_ga15202 [Eleusine coracana subsp. coracana]
MAMSTRRFALALLAAFASIVHHAVSTTEAANTTAPAPDTAGFLRCLAADLPPGVVYTNASRSYTSVLQSSIKNILFVTLSTPTPLAIVSASNASHVQAAVRCGARHGLSTPIASYYRPGDVCGCLLSWTDDSGAGAGGDSGIPYGDSIGIEIGGPNRIEIRGGFSLGGSGVDGGSHTLAPSSVKVRRAQISSGIPRNFTALASTMAGTPRILLFTLCVLTGSISISSASIAGDDFVGCLAADIPTHLVQTPAFPSYAALLLSSIRNLLFATPGTPRPLAIVAAAEPSHAQAAAMVDPDDFFRNEQSIPPLPTAKGWSSI